MKKNTYQFREANNGDIASIKAIIFSVLKEYGLKPDENGIDSDLNDIEKNYTANNGYFGVVINTRLEICGTFGLFNLDGKNCEIRKMYFLTGIRGKGLGKKVLKLLTIKALEKGYSNIILETNSVLKEAVVLYTKFGFKQLETDHLSHRCDMAFKLALLNSTEDN